MITGLSGANTLYRLITLPEIPDTLLAEAVKEKPSGYYLYHLMKLPLLSSSTGSL